jgi:hypothetical protein
MVDSCGQPPSRIAGPGGCTSVGVERADLNLIRHRPEESRKDGLAELHLLSGFFSWHHSIMRRQECQKDLGPILMAGGGLRFEFREKLISLAVLTAKSLCVFLNRSNSARRPRTSARIAARSRACRMSVSWGWLQLLE